MPPAAAIEKSADQAADEIGIFAGVFDRQIGHQQRLRVEDLHKILGLLLILRDGDLQLGSRGDCPDCRSAARP